MTAKEKKTKYKRNEDERKDNKTPQKNEPRDKTQPDLAAVRAFWKAWMIIDSIRYQSPLSMGQDPLVTLSNSWTGWWEIHFCSTQSIFNLVSAIVWHFNRQVYPRAVIGFHWAQSLGLGEADDNIYYARLFRVGLQVWHVWHLLYQTSKTYWMWLLMVRITSLRVFVESFLPILAK